MVRRAREWMAALAAVIAAASCGTATGGDGDGMGAGAAGTAAGDAPNGGDGTSGRAGSAGADSNGGDGATTRAGSGGADPGSAGAGGDGSGAEGGASGAGTGAGGAGTGAGGDGGGTGGREPTARCGDGVVQSAAGELCDGDCPTSCPAMNACDRPSLGGSAANCDARCSHASETRCLGGDGCCPTGCARSTDADCGGPVFDVEVWADNQNRVFVRPTMLEAPFNSEARIRWHNIGAYEIWVVNFGSGTNWSQLAILGPGASTSSSSLAEGPWCAYDFGGTYRLGGLYYPTDGRAALTLRCVR